MIKFSLVQFNPILGDKKSNVEKMIDYMRLASENKAHVVVFPELALTGYMNFDDFYRLAESSNGSSIRAIQNAASNYGIDAVFGFPEKARKNILFNSAAYIDSSGNLLGIYRKNYLPQHSVFDENRYFRPGNTHLVVDRYGTRVGVIICYDAFFPEVARLPALKGADVLLILSASPSMRRGFFEILTRARAVENNMNVLYVNLTGVQDKIVFWGGSHAVDPSGNIISRAPYEVEYMLNVEVDPSSADRVSPFVPIFKDLRRETIEANLKALIDFEVNYDES